MPRRPAWLALSLAILGASALGALVLWRATHQPTAAQPRATAQAPPDVSEVGLVRPGSAAARQRAAETGVPEAAAPPAATEGSPSRSLRRVVVRGHVSGPVEDLESVVVSVFAREDGSSRVTRGPFKLHPDVSGRFEADVTPLLGPVGSMDLQAQIEFHARHPLCKPASATFRPADIALLPHAGELVHHLTLVLVHGTLISGRVQLSIAPTGMEAAVAAVPMSDGSVRSQSPVKGGGGLRRVAADGTYALRVQPGARYAVVAVARGVRPQTRVLDVPVEGEYLLDFELERGVELAGTLRLEAQPTAPGTLVFAALEQGTGSRVPLGADIGALCWLDGAFEWAQSRALTGPDGRFELTGLGPHEYGLSVLGLGIAENNLRSLHVGRFRAPARGLELGPLLAETELDFGPGDGRALTFRLRPPGAAGVGQLGPFECEPHGIVLLRLPPRSTYEVLVDGAVVGRITTTAPGSRSAWCLSR